MKIKTEFYCDNFQNFKRYGIPKAQLVIADIPYNLGANAYGSNPMWYVDGDNKKVKANLQVKLFSIQIIILTLQNTFIFVIAY